MVGTAQMSAEEINREFEGKASVVVRNGGFGGGQEGDISVAQQVKRQMSQSQVAIKVVGYGGLALANLPTTVSQFIKAINDLNPSTVERVPYQIVIAPYPQSNLEGSRLDELFGAYLDVQAVNSAFDAYASGASRTKIMVGEGRTADRPTYFALEKGSSDLSNSLTKLKEFQSRLTKGVNDCMQITAQTRTNDCIPEVESKALPSSADVMELLLHLPPKRAAVDSAIKPILCCSGFTISERFDQKQRDRTLEPAEVVYYCKNSVAPRVAEAVLASWHKSRPLDAPAADILRARSDVRERFRALYCGRMYPGVN